MKPWAQFLRQSVAVQGSITPYVMPQVIGFGVLALVICWVAQFVERHFQIDLGLAVGPFEIFGGVFGVLLVLRTNAGYDRWWEARKLWGGIVNQSRNLVITTLAYGPADPQWRQRFANWAAAFSHAARAYLRGEKSVPEIAALLGPETAAQIAAADHPPSVVAFKLAAFLQAAKENSQLDRFAFLQADRERALLIDHVGGCERILKTPLPIVYAIKIRRFIVLLLATLPFALLHTVVYPWLIALITMLVAYFLAALDQIGIHLQNPFAKANLSHLPLDEITATIQRNLQGLLAASESEIEVK
jgi:ion channel-forming bestrophin family protein